MICTSCGEDSVLEMADTAQTVCTKCGTVLTENNIVSEVTFGETGSGAAMVQGSFVAADQTRARAPAGYRQGQSQESREQTLANGRRRVQELAHGLNLGEHMQNVATRFFNLAVNFGFTKGRRTQYVAAACLYAAVRQNNGTQMLIDFSDLLEINVFVLGSTFLKLKKTLSISCSVIDPAIYITRFAALLDFGDETQKVALDATRLVHRMGRDWMQVGRRPSGICGACLLLAARMNNFRRTIEEVVQVVKIADVTLRKRLAEFKETASGSLTIEDFRSVWLDETADPPAFLEGIKKEEKTRRARERGDREDSVMTDVSESESIAGARAFKELADRAVEDDGVEAEDGTTEHEREGDMLPPPTPSTKPLGKRKRSDEKVALLEPRPMSQPPAHKNQQHLSSDDQLEEPPEDEAETNPDDLPDPPEIDQAVTEEISAPLAKFAELTAELDHRDEEQLEKARALKNITTGIAFDQSERLDDLDEDELDAFILTEEEVEMKRRVWMETNKDYLRELADKQTGPDGELRPVSKRPRKRTKPKDSANATGTTAADATKLMLEKKKFSKKINYDAIKRLLDKGGSEAGSTYAGSDDEEGSDAEDMLIGQSYGSKRRKRRGISKKGTPIAVPIPTFGSRASSRAPSVSGAGSPPASGRDHYEDEEEEEHEPAGDEDNAWGSQFGSMNQDDGWADGYDEV
ncbi:transcription factor TFIIIB subunit BRF1 [Sporobolomyces koalae]|uniref:transcription factor TFIIIB subunit BRF1 n=1 Tax=Sporobolomyces koalae TaxID=500713 RepID=UPI00317B6AB8